jgi:hypothetical protein
MYSNVFRSPQSLLQLDNRTKLTVRAWGTPAALQNLKQLHSFKHRAIVLTTHFYVLLPLTFRKCIWVRPMHSNVFRTPQSLLELDNRTKLTVWGKGIPATPQKLKQLHSFKHRAIVLTTHPTHNTHPTHPTHPTLSVT